MTTPSFLPSFLLSRGEDTYAYTLIKRHRARKSLEREAIDTTAALIEFRRSTVRDVREPGSSGVQRHWRELRWAPLSLSLSLPLVS